MSMQDPISDMFTRIRNAQSVKKTFVRVPLSKVKKAIAKVLKDEGYILDFSLKGEKKLFLELSLKYFEGVPVIEKILRVSKPGLRVYKSYQKLNSVRSGLGISIVSTSKGIMSDKSARVSKLGGEILAEVA